MREVKITRCLEKCGKQWRLKLRKAGWQKQKKEEKKEKAGKRQEKKEQKKEKKKPKKERKIEVRRIAKE